MIDFLKKWIHRKWSNYVVYEVFTVSDINGKETYKKIVTLKKISNDGLIKFKTVKNF